MTRIDNLNTFNLNRKRVKEAYKQMVADGGVKMDPEFRLRQTGRSTARAFAYIATAMNNPNQFVDIENHMVDGKFPNRFMNDLLYHTITDFLSQLNLTSFEFKQHSSKPMWQMRFVLTPWRDL